jgi:hypothetical protein
MLRRAAETSGEAGPGEKRGANRHEDAAGPCSFKERAKNTNKKQDYSCYDETIERVPSNGGVVVIAGVSERIGADASWRC